MVEARVFVGDSKAKLYLKVLSVCVAHAPVGDEHETANGGINLHR
jgi:hypothetical protein